MDTINETIGKYKKELMMFVPSSIFVLYVINRNRIYLEQFFELSTIERILIFILIGFILGKFFYTLGKFFIMILNFLLIQKNKINFFKEKFKSILNRMALTGKILEEDDSIITTEILCYIGSKDFLKIRNEEIHSDVVFWETILGCSIFVLIYLSFNYPLKDILIVLVPISVSSIISYYYQVRSSNFWHDCALSFERSKKL